MMKHSPSFWKKIGTLLYTTLNLGAVIPKIIGGTGVSSKLSLQGTTGNGTTTATAVEVLTGNNGETTAVRVLNDKRVGLGRTPVYNFDMSSDFNTFFRVIKSNISEGTGFFRVDNYTASNPGIFAPLFWAKSNNVGYPGLAFLGDTTTDTGTVALLRFIARQNNTTVATRPLVEFMNNATTVMNILANGNVGIGTTTPNSKLQVAGSMSLPYVAKTGAYTLTDADYTVDCTANTFTVTLPTAVGIQGRIYNIKNTGAGVITVDGSGSQTIDGNLTVTLTQYDSITIQSTNSGWIIL